MIHFNSSSLYSNFSKIKDYLQQLPFKCSVLAVSETWPLNWRAMNYLYTNKVNKRGGGVALFVMNSITCKTIDHMSIGINDLMEM